MSDELNNDLPWHDIGEMKVLFAPEEGDGGADTGVLKAATSVRVENVQVALFQVEGEVFATDDRCTHGNAYLSEGTLEGHEVECPMHAAAFDVRTGQVLCGPATRNTRCHAVRLDEGKVFIRITPRT